MGEGQWTSSASARLCLFVLCGLAGIGGCDLNSLVPEEARTFVVPAESEVTVPGSQLAGANPLVPDEVLPEDLGPALSSQLAQSFSTEGIDRDAVGSAQLTSMRVVVLEPEEGGRRVRDLGFLNRVRFSIGAAEIAPELVAFSEDGAFADDPVAYDFQVTEAELADQIRAAEALEMSGEVETNRRPTFATTLRFEVELTVVADLAGALN